jgi:signal transduction histidine kinase
MAANRDIDRRVTTSVTGAADIGLEAQNAELEAYAHTVAHQLRLPLSGILLTAQLLDEDCDMLSSDDLHRDLKAIASQALKMSDIIDGLLLLSRIRERPVEIRPVDMGRIVSEVLNRLAPVIAEYQAEVRLPKSWPKVLGYGPWIEEVWVNYISNAVKYGGRPPCIELGASLHPDGKICFTVKDNGQGLKAEDRQHLFLPFRRIGKSPVDGSGLGLSIVRRMTERLRGHVIVESAEGQGSIFGFALEAAPPE